MYWGELEYKGKRYRFHLDGQEVVLVSDDNQYSPFALFRPVWDGDLSGFEERCLEGSLYPSGRRIHMFSHRRVQLRDGQVVIILDYIIEYTGDPLPIGRIVFSCRELDYIYDTGKAINQLSFDMDDGSARIEVMPTTETSTQGEVFNYAGKEVTCILGVHRSLNSNVKNIPIALSSQLYLFFEDTYDFVWISRLVRFVYGLLMYMCYRKNIASFIIKLDSRDEGGLFQKCANFYWFEQEGIPLEDERIYSKRYLRYTRIKGNLGKMLQDIVNKKLYIEHMPISYSDSKHITIARFVLLTAAFEWEFRRFCPEGIIISKQRAQAQEEIRSHLSDLIESSSGKKKGIYKYLIRRVDDDALEQKIIFACNKLHAVIYPFGVSLYENNGIEFKYAEIGERIAQQRNNYAHGNLNMEFIGPSLTDIVFMQYIVYAMQLSQYIADDPSIRKALADILG